MDLIWQKFTDWLKEILIGGIKDALSGLFDTVNTRVGEIAGQVGATPQGWNGGIYNMIRSLSDNVILPIAGVILAIVMTMELIQIITDKTTCTEKSIPGSSSMGVQNGLCGAHCQQHLEYRYGRVRCGAERGQQRFWRCGRQCQP